MKPFLVALIAAIGVGAVSSGQNFGLWRVIPEASAPASTPCTDAGANAIYVRQGASGAASGADWTNAVTSMPTAPTRGKTYCVADTTTGYSQWAINTLSVSATPVKFVKATVADHGTSTGWLDSYGDGQAIFTSSSEAFVMNATGGFITIDGNRTASQCGTIAALAGATQDCGFKFVNTASGGGQVAFQWNAGGADSIVRSIEIQGPGGGGTSTAQFSPALAGDAQGYAAWTGGGARSTLQHSYIHNHVTQYAGVGDDAIIEYNYWANSRNSGGAAHSNVAFIGGSTNGLTWRYNYAKNFDDEGFFVTWFSSKVGPDNLKIYGNIFYSPGTTNPRGIELRQSDSAGDADYSNIVINNNTFGSLSTGGIYDRAGEGGSPSGHCTSCSATDNISVSAGNTFLETVSSNNTDDATTSRFVTYGSNFHLTAGLAGTSLASPYTTDLYGNTRGADGTWDRGALEFCSGGCSFTALQQPTKFWAMLWAPAPKARPWR